MEPPDFGGSGLGSARPRCAPQPLLRLPENYAVLLSLDTPLGSWFPSSEVLCFRASVAKSVSRRRKPHCRHDWWGPLRPGYPGAACPPDRIEHANLLARPPSFPPLGMAMFLA